MAKIVKKEIGAEINVKIVSNHLVVEIVVNNFE